MTKTEAVARISFLTPSIHIDALGKNLSSEIINRLNPSGVPDISDSGINNQSIVERFYGAGAAKYDQIPGLARPRHHLENFSSGRRTRRAGSLTQSHWPIAG
jgi:hypothetical protein